LQPVTTTTTAAVAADETLEFGTILWGFHDGLSHFESLGFIHRPMFKIKIKTTFPGTGLVSPRPFRQKTLRWIQ
jgi:hypothetical protein